MTLDVTIGEIIGAGPYNGGDIRVKVYGDNHEIIADVKQCPKADKDICDKGLTLWPRESYRSGSSAFWDFFTDGPLCELYLKMRNYPGSNDWDVAYLAPVADEITNIKEFGDEVDRDRLKWLKYWVAKAVELYGNKAGIQFT
jgi:hypothetical protein